MSCIAFGVFDGLHPGHQYFLYFASCERSRRLTVVVTSDAMALRYKGHDPERPPQEHRCAEIRRIGYNAVVGDETEGAYTAIQTSDPSTIIFVGYDQKNLENDLRQRMRRGSLPQRTIQQVPDYFGQLYHTSILRRKKHKTILWHLLQIRPPLKLVKEEKRVAANKQLATSTFTFGDQSLSVIMIQAGTEEGNTYFAKHTYHRGSFLLFSG